MYKFYDVHVFFSRHDGYSIAVKVETEKSMTDEEVIEYATDNDLFTDGGDENMVDYVAELNEEDYKRMTNTV